MEKLLEFSAEPNVLLTAGDPQGFADPVMHFHYGSIKGTIRMRQFLLISILTGFLPGCGTNQGTVDEQQIIGNWTYITDSGRGIGTLSFREDGTFSTSFEITTAVATTASVTNGTWSLHGDAISVEYAGYVATGSADFDGVTTSAKGASTYFLKGGMIEADGVKYFKD